MVNGPGEARETDIGLTGGGCGTHQIYVSGMADHRLSHDDIVDYIVGLVEKRSQMKAQEKGKLMEKINLPRGTSDLLPAEKHAKIWSLIWPERWPPVMGLLIWQHRFLNLQMCFSRPLSDASDVVSKETYSFRDRGGGQPNAAPEGTASVMRALISNG